MSENDKRWILSGRAFAVFSIKHIYPSHYYHITNHHDKRDFNSVLTCSVFHSDKERITTLQAAEPRESFATTRYMLFLNEEEEGART